MSHAGRLRLFYFLYYVTAGAYVPYIAAYMRGIGFSGEQIGLAQMMSPLMAVPAVVAGTALSERLRQPTRALRLVMLWSVVALAFLLVARTPAAVGLVILAYGLGDRSVTPLVDSIALEHVRTRPRLSYSGLRLFGSMGFIVSAQGLGILLSLRGDRLADLAVPAVAVTGAAAAALVTRGLPMVPAPERQPTLGDVKKLLRDPRLILLVLAGALHWAGCSPYHMLFGVFVQDLGLPARLTGLAMVLGVAAEVLVFSIFPALERRFPLWVLLAIGFGGTSLRWLLLSQSQSVPVIVGLQVLHCCTIALFWAPTMALMSAIVPPSLRVAGQAVVTAVIFGLANAAGFLVAGAGYDRLGGVAPLYGWAALLELVPLGLTLLLSRRLATARPAGLPIEPSPGPGP